MASRNRFRVLEVDEEVNDEVMTAFAVGVEVLEQELEIERYQVNGGNGSRGKPLCGSWAAWEVSTPDQYAMVHE